MALTNFQLTKQIEAAGDPASFLLSVVEKVIETLAKHSSDQARILQQILDSYPIGSLPKKFFQGILDLEKRYSVEPLVLLKQAANKIAGVCNTLRQKNFLRLAGAPEHSELATVREKLPAPPGSGSVADSIPQKPSSEAIRFEQLPKAAKAPSQAPDASEQKV